MLGSLNKLLRNVASLKGKSAFDKSLIKATYSGDMKEPKEKHLIFIMECMKGKHLELIRPKEALAKLFDRFFNNLTSFSLIIKSLNILHRALQEEEISQMVAHKIKEKENLLYPYQKEDQTYETKMQCFICELYINYIKNLISFIIICQLFSISLKDLQHYTKTLEHQELFLIFSRIDALIESILKVFEQKQYCQTHRILQSVIYLVFVDLLQIYQSYYLLITVMLEKFDEMSLKDAKRAFIIYLNFIKINKEIRKMASSIISEFNIRMGISFYDIDTKVIEALKISIEVKEKEKMLQSKNSGGSTKSNVMLGSEMGSSVDLHGGLLFGGDKGSDMMLAQFNEKMISPQLERVKTTMFAKTLKLEAPKTETKAIYSKGNKLLGDDLPQGGQGVQRKNLLSELQKSDSFQSSNFSSYEEEKQQQQQKVQQQLQIANPTEALRRAAFNKSHTDRNLLKKIQSQQQQQDQYQTSEFGGVTSSDQQSEQSQIKRQAFRKQSQQDCYSNDQEEDVQTQKQLMASKLKEHLSNNKLPYVQATNSYKQSTFKKSPPKVAQVDDPKLTIFLHEMSLLSSSEHDCNFYSVEHTTTLDKQLSSQQVIKSSLKNKEPPQSILLQRYPSVVVNGLQRSKSQHKVKFTEEIEDDTPQQQQEVNRFSINDQDDEDEDYAEFKSLKVPDDQIEDFFEALEPSPRSKQLYYDTNQIINYPFDSFSPKHQQQPQRLLSPLSNQQYLASSPHQQQRNNTFGLQVEQQLQLMEGKQGVGVSEGDEGEDGGKFEESFLSCVGGDQIQ